jgi:hypothetical protein
MKAIASTTKQKVDNRAGRRRVGPTYGFVASHKVDRIHLHTSLQ